MPRVRLQRPNSGHDSDSASSEGDEALQVSSNHSPSRSKKSGFSDPWRSGRRSGSFPVDKRVIQGVEKRKCEIEERDRENFIAEWSLSEDSNSFGTIDRPPVRGVRGRLSAIAITIV